MIIYGKKDELVPIEYISELNKRLSAQKGIKVEFSAIAEVYKQCKKKNIPIIADGGVRYSGDVAKAIGAGADSVMIGSLLAGTEESPGETIIYDGRKFKTYRGMGSVEAMKKGSKDRYFQDVEDDLKKLVPELFIPHPKERMKQIPHEISGGMRQRNLIAMKMLMEPSILIADEPTTALDVTIQAQIIDLLSTLVQEKKMSMILITHDMGVGARFCERVNVMYGGYIVEQADVKTLFSNPAHPYTAALLAATPDPSQSRQVLQAIPGIQRTRIGMQPNSIGTGRPFCSRWPWGWGDAGSA